MTQAPFQLQPHNPDVLMCIANLSNDEVFTPPELVNQMLDTLAMSWASTNNGANIWADKEVSFLDPCTKSGVFLREITKRLTVGLEEQIPDLTERVNHILTKQVYGIAITELTSLLARRSVYCSKYANGIHSVARKFRSEEGNIWFERTEHKWIKGSCQFCGASKAEYARGASLETHAYRFVHSEHAHSLIKELFGGKMHFDVVIGNPPYQLSTGGTGGAGVQARPIYNLFVEQAKSLDPRYLCMVTPSRWFSGGMGLDEFRESMLKDSRIRVIQDFPDSNDVFPGTQIKGGVSYFLWDRDNPGDAQVSTINNGKVVSVSTRPIIEPGLDIFVRYNEGINILKKVFKVEGGDIDGRLELPVDKRFINFVSAIGPFGLGTTFRGKDSARAGDVKVYRNGGIGYIARREISKETRVIDKWKVFIPPAGSGSDSFPHPILGKPFVGEPGSISSWTYLYIGPFKNRGEATNVVSYISTRLFRFLVLLRKSTQHATRSVYTFVPNQDFSKSWTDEELYSKYKLTQGEIAFVESMVRPAGDADE